MNRLFTTLLFFSCTFSLSAQQIVAKIQLNGTAEILPAEIPAQVSGGTPTENRFGEPNSALSSTGRLRFYDENGRTVEVFDMQGKRVARTEFKPALDLDNLPSGVYLIVVSDDKGKVLLREKTLIISSIRP